MIFFGHTSREIPADTIVALLGMRPSAIHFVSNDKALLD